MNKTTELIINYKKLIVHAIEPTYANDTDAGLDFYAIDDGCYDNYYKFSEYDTGISLEIPEGYVGLIFPRSSISKTPHILCNSVGVIDSGYRGSIKFRFKNVREAENLEYKFGDKIGQLIIIPVPKIKLNEVDNLTNTTRGHGGFGSSGK